MVYGSINSIPTNLSSNSTQQVEQVHNYVEEDMQVEVHQRLNDDREFNLVEGNDQQVILAKADSSNQRIWAK